MKHCMSQGPIYPPAHPPIISKIDQKILVDINRNKYYKKNQFIINKHSNQEINLCK